MKVTVHYEYPGVHTSWDSTGSKSSLGPMQATAIHTNVTLVAHEPGWLAINLSSGATIRYRSLRVIWTQVEHEEENLGVGLTD